MCGDANTWAPVDGGCYVFIIKGVRERDLLIATFGRMVGASLTRGFCWD